MVGRHAVERESWCTHHGHDKGAMVQLKETVMFSCILSIVCPFDVLHLLHVAMGERY